MTEDNEHPCSRCGDEGHVDDPLSSAMGGRWFRYCECPVGIAASEEDRAASRETIRARATRALTEESAPEMLEILQGILGAHRMHEVILTAGYEKRILAVIAKATDL